VENSGTKLGYSRLLFLVERAPAPPARPRLAISHSIAPPYSTDLSSQSPSHSLSLALFWGLDEVMKLRSKLAGIEPRQQ